MEGFGGTADPDETGEVDQMGKDPDERKAEVEAAAPKELVRWGPQSEGLQAGHHS